MIANNAARKPKNLWTDAGRGDRIVRYHAEDEGDEATFVASTAIASCTTTTRANWRDIAVLYRTNAQSRVVEEAMMRLGVPYKVVGGTRFYDRREIKDAMAYLRAVVNPADEVSVKRVLNVPKRGVGDASIAKLDALAAAERHRLPRGPARAPTRPASPGRPCAGSTRSSPCSTGSGRWRPPARPSDDGEPDAVPATCCRRRSSESGYLAELEAEDTVESAGRLENLAELVGSAREFTRIDEFLEQVSLVADTDELPDGEADDQVVLMTLHSAKGLEFPVVFLIGVEDGVFPHSPRAHRAGRAGGGAAPRLRRDHPGEGAALRHPRLEPQPVRLDAVQPAVAVPRRDPRRAGRRPGQRHRAQQLRPPEPAAALRLGIGRGAGVPPARSRFRAPPTSGAPTFIASGSSRRRSRPASGRLRRARRPRTRPAIGDDVEHPAFGEGVVIDIAGTARRPKPR